MKKTFILLLVIIISNIAFAQPRDMREPRDQMRGRLEQFEQIRLLEILNLDEEVAVKFIIRRNNHREAMRTIMDKRRKLIDELQGKIEGNAKSDDEIKGLIGKILNIEKELADERSKFINALSPLLTTKQIAKVVAFEDRFKEDVKELIEGRGPKENMR